MSSEKRKMLAEEEVHTSPCPQSIDHVSAPQNCDSLTLMDGQQLSCVKAPALGITSILSDSPDVASGTDDDIYRPGPASDEEIRQWQAEYLGRSEAYERQKKERILHEVEQNSWNIRKNICRLAAQLVDAKIELNSLRSQLSPDLKPDCVAEIEIVRAVQLQEERQKNNPTGNKFCD